jgi:hypothetical protein
MQSPVSDYAICKILTGLMFQSAPRTRVQGDITNPESWSAGQQPAELFLTNKVIR